MTARLLGRTKIPHTMSCISGSLISRTFRLPSVAAILPLLPFLSAGLLRGPHRARVGHVFIAIVLRDAVGHAWEEVIWADVSQAVHDLPDTPRPCPIGPSAPAGRNATVSAKVPGPRQQAFMQLHKLPFTLTRQVPEHLPSIANNSSSNMLWQSLAPLCDSTIGKSHSVKFLTASWEAARHCHSTTPGLRRSWPPQRPARRAAGSWQPRARPLP